MIEPKFTLGIEEEYLLVDRDSRDLASNPPPELFADCEAALEGRVSPEFLKCQIEVGTPVCATIEDARRELRFLRKTIVEKANAYGLAPIAASTHPFAEWMRQPHTDKERYNELSKTMKVVADRLMICGMHVHIGIEDDELKIDIFNQLSYFLPHLLALSTSSPFWRGRDTGLKSYRLAVFNELPRTGLPETFESHAEYLRTIDTLVRAGVIEDGTKIWWDLRPSARFPTLEMRITDVCPRLEDTLAIAALFQCLCRMLYRLRRSNMRWRNYSRFLIAENRWQAQRHGTHARLIDYGQSTLVPYCELIEELIDLVKEDIAFFGCEAEINHIRKIAAEGTSADRQLNLFEAETGKGATVEDALKKVVDQLITETVEGL